MPQKHHEDEGHDDFARGPLPMCYHYSRSYGRHRPLNVYDAITYQVTQANSNQRPFHDVQVRLCALGWDESKENTNMEGVMWYLVS